MRMGQKLGMLALGQSTEGDKGLKNITKMCDRDSMASNLMDPDDPKARESEGQRERGRGGKEQGGRVGTGRQRREKRQGEGGGELDSSHMLRNSVQWTKTCTSILTHPLFSNPLFFLDHPYTPPMCLPTHVLT